MFQHLTRKSQLFPLLILLTSQLQAQVTVNTFTGMWSDPPPTIEGMNCFFACTDEGLELLYSMLDDPANDDVSLEDMVDQVLNRDIGGKMQALLTDFSRESFPLDQSKSPVFTKCEPPGLGEQLFMPHQFKITEHDDHIALNYGEWDAHRKVYTDGRSASAGMIDTKMGFSTGYIDGDTLVINTSHLSAGILGAPMNHSNQLQTEERYTISENNQVLTVHMTFTDALALTGPLALKRFWSWAPDEVIDPYVDCQIPTDYLESLGEQ